MEQPDAQLPEREVFAWELLGSRELEITHRNQLLDFREAYHDAIRENSKVIDIEDRMHILDHPTKSIDQQLVKDIAGRSEGKLCLSPEYQWLQGAGFSSFNVIRSSRAETSAHQVFFGVMHDPDDETRGLPVAVKPCEDKAMTACQDWLNGSLAKREGERTFKPVGFILHDNRGYSLTELESEVETLDSTEWDRVLLEEHNPAYEGQRELIGGVAVSLAELHRKNVFHGDPQFKNIALDITGEVFLIDWESATFYEKSPKFQEMHHKLMHDLKVVFRSMALPEDRTGVGLLSPFTHKIQWQLFRQYFFDTYMESYLEGVKADEVQVDLAGELEESLREYIENGEIYRSFSRARTN